jgi:hypothetical protein
VALDEGRTGSVAVPTGGQTMSFDRIGYPNVQVRTTVEAERLQIIQALTAREVNMQEMVNAAVDAALKDGALARDVQRQVADQVHRCIEQEIKDAIRRAFYSDEMRDRIAKVVAEGMKP